MGSSRDPMAQGFSPVVMRKLSQELNVRNRLALAPKVFTVGMKSANDAETAQLSSRLGNRQRQETLREGQKNTKVEKWGRAVRVRQAQVMECPKSQPCQHLFEFSLMD